MSTERTAEDRLKELGIRLPAPRAPIATFTAAVLEGNLLFLSGQGPVTDQPKDVGKVGDQVTVDEGYRHARIAGLNLLAQIEHALGSLNRVARVVKVLGLVNAVPSFAEHPKVINGCSDLFIEVFGPTIGSHARSAIGVASLPGGITVEVEAIVAVRGFG